MAYVPANLSLTAQNLAGGYRIWVYESTDAFATVAGTDYFSDGEDKGMQLDDLVVVRDSDATPPALTFAAVSAIDADGNATVAALGVTGGAGSFTTLTASGTVTLGDAAADVMKFHGATGTSQRASSVQATSNLASSSDFGATQLAWAVEVTNTLNALGLWKGTA